MMKTSLGAQPSGVTSSSAGQPSAARCCRAARPGPTAATAARAIPLPASAPRLAVRQAREPLTPAPGVGAVFIVLLRSSAVNALARRTHRARVKRRIREMAGTVTGYLNQVVHEFTANGARLLAIDINLPPRSGHRAVGAYRWSCLGFVRQCVADVSRTEARVTHR